MRARVIGWWLPFLCAVGCSRAEHGLIGERYRTGEVSGWVVADRTWTARFAARFGYDPLTSAALHVRTRVNALVKPGQDGPLPAIVVTEVIDEEPAAALPTTPQAALMGTSGRGVVESEPTIESCRRIVEGLGHVEAVRVVTYGALTGCEMIAGHLRATSLTIDHALVRVTCVRETAADPELDRACDAVLHSIRPRVARY